MNINKAYLCFSCGSWLFYFSLVSCFPLKVSVVVEMLHKDLEKSVTRNKMAICLVI